MFSVIIVTTEYECDFLTTCADCEEKYWNEVIEE